MIRECVRTYARPNRFITRQDIEQEVFIACLKDSPKFDPSKGSYTDFLFGVSRMRVRKLFNELKRRSVVRGPEQDMWDVDVSYEQAVPDEWPVIVQKMLKNAKLTTKEQRAISMLYLHGKSRKEICKEFKRTGRAVNQLLLRARTKLRVMGDPRK